MPLAQISLVRTMKGATDSDQRESSVPKVKGRSDTHPGAPGLAVRGTLRSFIQVKPALTKRIVKPIQQ